MKRFLSLVFLAIMMVVITPQVFSQEYFRLLRNRVPVPLTPPRPIMPPFHYPPGVVPAMTNMPLPTRNPSFDVDLSVPPMDDLLAPGFCPLDESSVTGKVSVHVSPSLPTHVDHLLEMTPPVPPQRFQPVPALQQSQKVVRGVIVAVSQKKSDTPFVTPHIIIQEEYKEPEVTTQTQPVIAPSLQIVGPLTTPEPSANTPVESDPFNSVFVEEDNPVIIVAPAAEDKKAEESAPLVETVEPTVVAPEADENETEEANPFDTPFL